MDKKKNTQNIENRLTLKLSQYIENNIESFQNDLKEIDKAEVRAKLFLEILKLYLTRTKDMESDDSESKMQSLFFERMFPEQK